MRRRRSTALHVMARMGLLHDFTKERGVEFPPEEAYLTKPVLLRGEFKRIRIDGRFVK